MNLPDQFVLVRYKHCNRYSHAIAIWVDRRSQQIFESVGRADPWGWYNPGHFSFGYKHEIDIDAIGIMNDILQHAQPDHITDGKLPKAVTFNQCTFAKGIPVRFLAGKYQDPISGVRHGAWGVRQFPVERMIVPFEEVRHKGFARLVTFCKPWRHYTWQDIENACLNDWQQGHLTPLLRQFSYGLGGWIKQHALTHKEITLTRLRRSLFEDHIRRFPSFSALTLAKVQTIKRAFGWLSQPTSASAKRAHIKTCIQRHIRRHPAATDRLRRFMQMLAAGFSLQRQSL